MTINAFSQTVIKGRVFHEKGEPLPGVNAYLQGTYDGRKYIVSIDACTNILAWTNSRLRLKIDTIGDPGIIVARERIAEFKNWLDR